MLWVRAVRLDSPFLQDGLFHRSSFTFRQIDVHGGRPSAVQICPNPGPSSDEDPALLPAVLPLGGKGGHGQSALWPEHPRICRVCWEEAIFSSPPQKSSSSWFKVLCDLHLPSEAPSSCFSVIPASPICLFSLTLSLFSPLCPPCPLLFSSHLDKPRGLASCQGGSTSELADHHGRTSQLNLQRGRGVR